MAARVTRPHAHKRDASPENDDADGSSPGRGLWSGSISFGLLQIPVMLYTAERRAEEIHFRQLDKIGSYLDGHLVTTLRQHAGAELRANLSSLSSEEAAVLMLLRDRLAGKRPAPASRAPGVTAPQPRARAA